MKAQERAVCVSCTDQQFLLMPGVRVIQVPDTVGTGETGGLRRSLVAGLVLDLNGLR